MKKWLIVEAVMVVAIIFLGCLIKIQMTPVAQAKDFQPDSFELLVQTENGLVRFSEVQIVTLVVVETDTAQETENFTTVIFSHQQEVQQKILQIEPELGETLIRLAHCESSLNPQAVGDNGNSHGLYQIFLKWHPDVTQAQAQDIEFATRWTASKIRQGKGDLWTCWSKI
jgi:hypothetical protein